MFSKTHIYIKGGQFHSAEISSMSQLLYDAAYYCASKQQILSNIGCFLAEKWPTTIETGWEWVKLNNETYLNIYNKNC